MEKRNIVVLGSTGSIGQSTLEVVRANPERLGVVGLSAGRNLNLLIRQIREFRPGQVAMTDEEGAGLLKEMFPELTVFSGPQAACHLLEEVPARLAVAAISGMAGLAPIAMAIRRGMDIALANKEALVSAGVLLMQLADEHRVSMLPVDSEHSAIWQVLQGKRISEVRRLILTASGGPFRGRTREELEAVTADEALRHPTWKMGGKISVDSATMMNKGLELIEAHFLFGLPYDSIEVVVHPESQVHSMVEFVDGSILAQCSQPDMRIPIQLALSYPHRWPAQWVQNRLNGCSWSFEKPDTDVFRCLKLAAAAARQGDSCPTVLNAANEEAVQAFIAGRLAFLGIEAVIERTLSKVKPVKLTSMEDVFAADAQARCLANAEIDAIGGAHS